MRGEREPLDGMTWKLIWWSLVLSVEYSRSSPFGAYSRVPCPGPFVKIGPCDKW